MTRTNRFRRTHRFRRLRVRLGPLSRDAQAEYYFSPEVLSHSLAALTALIFK
jgi:hypothetical protein